MWPSPECYCPIHRLRPALQAPPPGPPASPPRPAPPPQLRLARWLHPLLPHCWRPAQNPAPTRSRPHHPLLAASLRPLSAHAPPLAALPPSGSHAGNCTLGPHPAPVAFAQRPAWPPQCSAESARGGATEGPRYAAGRSPAEPGRPLRVETLLGSRISGAGRGESQHQACLTAPVRNSLSLAIRPCLVAEWSRHHSALSMPPPGFRLAQQTRPSRSGPPAAIQLRPC